MAAVQQKMISKELVRITGSSMAEDWTGIVLSIPALASTHKLMLYSRDQTVKIYYF